MRYTDMYYGSAQGRRKAKTWANDDEIHWCKYIDDIIINKVLEKCYVNINLSLSFIYV